MVGIAEIRDPAAVSKRLEVLRAELLSDPYFAGASSLHPERRKTALTFHAKDDLPEVRWRVYEQLRRFDIRVAVAVRRKAVLEAYARSIFRAGGLKWRPDDVYDELVVRLFSGRLRTADKHHVTFAVRRTAKRDTALLHALDRARTSYGCSGRCSVASERPDRAVGLQVVDYYLWATQRLFERAEGRFFAGMAKQIEYVWDIDDTRQGAAGVRYDGKRRILTPEGMLPLAPARFEESLEYPA